MHGCAAATVCDIEHTTPLLSQEGNDKKLPNLCQERRSTTSPHMRWADKGAELTHTPTAANLISLVILGAMLATGFAT